MGISSIKHGGPVATSTPATTTTTSSPKPSDPADTTSGGPAPAPAPTGVNVPKGQLDRTRANLPQGWFNDGGHNGFKPAVIHDVAEGYHLAAVNRSDIPRGRQ